MNVGTDEGIVEAGGRKREELDRRREKKGRRAASRLSSKGNVATTLCMAHLHRASASSAFKDPLLPLPLSLSFSLFFPAATGRSDPVCARVQKIPLRKNPPNPFVVVANRRRLFPPGPTLSRFTKDPVRQNPSEDYVFFHATSKAISRECSTFIDATRRNGTALARNFQTRMDKLNCAKNQALIPSRYVSKHRCLLRGPASVIERQRRE